VACFNHLFTSSLNGTECYDECTYWVPSCMHASQTNAQQSATLLQVLQVASTSYVLRFATCKHQSHQHVSLPQQEASHRRPRMLVHT
jgi:hypothetical protein